MQAASAVPVFLFAITAVASQAIYPDGRNFMTRKLTNKVALVTAGSPGTTSPAAEVAA